VQAYKEPPNAAKAHLTFLSDELASLPVIIGKRKRRHRCPSIPCGMFLKNRAGERDSQPASTTGLHGRQQVASLDGFF
jgi:hypothetical protein